MNSNNSKKYFTGCSFLQHLLRAAYGNTWDGGLEKNNSTGADLSVFHFQQNFVCDFWTKKEYSELAQ